MYIDREGVKLKYIKIALLILVSIVGILNIIGMWENTTILLLMLSILNIFNARDSYNNNRKIEAGMLFIGAIFAGLVAIDMLLS